jgi:PAS domain S-box-containing protein
MLELLGNLFTSGPFIPHEHCYLWNTELVWLHLLSDALIALAYYSIPLTLLYFVQKRKDFPFGWIFLLFGVFIVACGTTHLMEIWTLWHPTYWLSGAIKAFTALVSLYTAVMLVALVPQALAIPSPAQLEATNRELQTQMSERQQAEAALRSAHGALEGRVQERTTDLEQANQALQVEIAEHKRTATALQEVTTLQQAILDSANYTIISTTVEGVILTFNQAAERWLGYDAAEVVGKTTPVIIHDRDEVVQRSQELSQELGVTIEPGFEAFVAKPRRGEIDEREWSYIRKDGSRFPVMLSITALRDAEHHITGFLGIGSDISDRKLAEEEARRQNRRSQLFAEVTLKIRQSLQLEEILQTTVTEVHRILQADRVLIFQLLPDGSGTVVQEAVVPGWPVTLGQGIVDPCFHEGYLEQYRQGRIGTIADVENNDTQPCYIEFLQQLAVKANLVVPILLRENLWGLLIAHQCDHPRQWTDFETELLGQLANQMGIALAQSQLLEQEIQQRQELTRSQQELQTMSTALESAVEGISQLDTQGRYLNVNPAYARMVGYQPEELLNMDWGLVVHPDDRERLSAAYQQMLTSGKAEVEARALRKDGSVFDKQVVMVKAYDQQQQFIGHYCFMKDISDRREVERLKDEFISIVSHELRTPLTSIAGALDLLAGGVLQAQPQDAQQMLMIAANNTERLVRLINDILDIERIESGKVVMTKQVCEASQLMTQSVEVVQDMAAPAGVTLSVSPLAARLWADPDRIIQVFTNLLSNAIKFSPSESTVWLTAELRETCSSGEPIEACLVPRREIWFQVRDQGRGIPADKLESIFERFQQVDASDSRQRGGTGLGLAICRSILHQHGGRIWAESQLGEGSRFFFTLPVLWEVNSEPSQISDPTRPLVLECDDDSSVRAVVRTMLEQQGYQVIAVASGLEAIEQAVKLRPAAILLNLIMPGGLDGWETLAILKQQVETKDIPVIILSGLSPDARKFPYPSVSDWIVKPPDPKLLRQALEKVLASADQPLQVLVVEDDPDLAQILLATFNRHGFATFHAPTGRDAIQLSQSLLPDLLILDLGLPECDGFAVVEWLRQHNRLCQVPLVVYTAQDLGDRDRDRLKLGQTLFLTKGRISPQEFEQRVMNLLNWIIRGKKTQNLSEHQQ